MPSFKDLYQAKKSDFTQVIAIFKDTRDDRDPESYYNEYKGDRTRRPGAIGYRKPKTVGEGSDAITIIPAKIVFNFPKKIVQTAVAFLCGGDMILTFAIDDDSADLFKAIFTEEMKMQSIIKEFTRVAMVETKAAMIFFPQEKIPYIIEGTTITSNMKLRAKVLDHTSGIFYPHFDDYGDLDAFFWKTQSTDESGNPISIIRIYTEDYEIIATEVGGKYEVKQQANLFGKIPVVYVDRDQPEWEDVVEMMDRFEMRISRVSDTNDYFSEPMLMLMGKPVKLPSKDTMGKVVQFDMQTGIDGKPVTGDAKYLTWDQFPESIRLELETLWNGIYSGTNTPDLSFDNVKGLGANISGYALKMMMLDAIIKANENREVFGKAYSRILKVVRAGVSGIISPKFKTALDKNSVSVKFSNPLPDDVKEAVEVIMTATGNEPILSQEGGVLISPLTKNKDEFQRIQSEATTRAKNEQSAQFGSFNTGDNNPPVQ